MVGELGTPESTGGDALGSRHSPYVNVVQLYLQIRPFIAQLNKQVFFWVTYSLQSCHSLETCVFKSEVGAET